MAKTHILEAKNLPFLGAHGGPWEPGRGRSVRRSEEGVRCPHRTGELRCLEPMAIRAANKWLTVLVIKWLTGLING